MSKSRWRNWSGSVSCFPTEVLRPSTLDEIVSIVRSCAESGMKIRTVGSGHSFTPLAATDHVLVTLERYTGVERVDVEACTATIKAGTTLKALGDLLFQHGLAQENLGDINEQSIAGAISTGTHGTGIQFGTLSTQVTEISLVTGMGELVTCSEAENSALFRAAQISLGVLGIIVSVTLRLVPTYTLHINIERKSLSDCVTNLEDYNRENRHFEFHWLPFTDTVQAKFTNISQGPPSGPSLVRKLNEYVIENGALWLFSAFNRQFPSMTERVCKTMSAFVSNASGIGHAHTIFASVRLVKFQEMEFNLPQDHFRDALSEIDEMIRRERIRVHFPIECRFVRGDDIFLSPAHGRDSAYIAVHMFNGMPYENYFRRVEAICRNHGGRPHWGKMHFLKSNDLAPLYPRWDDFQEQRTRCDPDQIFTTPYLQSILG